MDAPDFGGLRAGRSDCPSEQRLVRFAGGELDPAAAAEIAAHVNGCELCAARVAAHGPELDAERAKRAMNVIQARLEERRSTPSASPSADPEPTGFIERLRPFLIGAGGLVAASLVALLFVGRGPGSPPPGEGREVRMKSGLALHVLRKDGEGTVELESEARFRTGDQLRFVVDLPEPGHVRIFGLESGGAPYLAWPRSEEVETMHSAGMRQLLAGAVRLDESTGRETLHLVLCPAEAGSRRAPSRTLPRGRSAHLAAALPPSS